MTHDLPPHVYGLASACARKALYRYRAPYEVEDLTQDLLLHLLTVTNIDVHAADHALLVTIMDRRARRIMLTARKKDLAAVEPEQHYAPAQVEALLPFVFQGTDGFTDGSDATELARALVADVTSALALIPREDTLLLAQRYGEDLTCATIANAYGVSESIIHRKTAKAVERLMKALSGEPPVWMRETTRPQYKEI